MRQIKQHQILQIGNPILNVLCKPLSFPLSEHDKDLIKDLKFVFRENLKQRQVLGLAAPQIGIDKRFFIMPKFFNYSSVSDRVRHMYAKRLDIIINPVIKEFGEEKCFMEETCLSLPNDTYDIQRPKKIKVQYYSESGDLIEKNFIGTKSRVFQHELDHLNGITIDLKGGKLIEDK